MKLFSFILTITALAINQHLVHAQTESSGPGGRYMSIRIDGERYYLLSRDPIGFRPLIPPIDIATAEVERAPDDVRVFFRKGDSDDLLSPIISRESPLPAPVRAVSGIFWYRHVPDTALVYLDTSRLSLPFFAPLQRDTFYRDLPKQFHTLTYIAIVDGPPDVVCTVLSDEETPFVSIGNPLIAPFSSAAGPVQGAEVIFCGLPKDPPEETEEIEEIEIRR